MLHAYDLLTGQIATLDQLVAQTAEPSGLVIARLVTSLGIGQRLAACRASLSVCMFLSWRGRTTRSRCCASYLLVVHDVVNG
jgi:hypothetical protein